MFVVVHQNQMSPLSSSPALSLSVDNTTCGVEREGTKIYYVVI